MSTVLSKNVINSSNTHELGLKIKTYWPKFDLFSFDREIQKNLVNQSLGERIQQVRKSLYNHLPKNYKRALNILVKTLPEILNNNAFNEKLDLASQNGFIMISRTSFVARYGIDQYELSMAALKEMTKRFSAEGSIRYFIEKYPDKCLKTFDKWVYDKSPHVRRLVSEGTRPRLPMTMALPMYKDDPTPILKYLEILKNDPELVVRRSVANNLNDISKDNPNIVTTLLKKWNKDKSKEMQWLIKHSLRTLEKEGDRNALIILGYNPVPQIKVGKFNINKKKIKLGESLSLKLNIKSTSRKSQKLLVDYVIYHMKASGKLTPKVFKWAKKTINKGEELNLSKNHTFKEISTRKYYSGRHEVHIQINGKIVTKTSFILLVSHSFN